MVLDAYAQGLADRIDSEYKASGNNLGWRFLYSPARVLTDARVAFIGMNPGGDFCPVDHTVFATDGGCAYELENWGAPPGKSRLQKEVIELFRWVGEQPIDVLAGNLVPFRSKDWASLRNSAHALTFGKIIWEQVLAKAQPKIVIVMGTPARNALKEMLDVAETESLHINWGKVSGERGSFAGGTFIGLPHLSRFNIVTRAASKEPLERLIGLEKPMSR